MGGNKKNCLHCHASLGNPVIFALRKLINILRDGDKLYIIYTLIELFGKVELKQEEAAEAKFFSIAIEELYTLLIEKSADTQNKIYNNISKLKGDKQKQFIISIKNLLNKYLDKNSLVEPLRLIIEVLENNRRCKEFLAMEDPKFAPEQFRYIDATDKMAKSRFFINLSSKPEKKVEKTAMLEETKHKTLSLTKGEV